MLPQIQIQFLGACMVSVNAQTYDNLASKSRKGVSLMEFLILKR